jgi:outer membrane lipoprotein-sorting protein
MKSFFLIALALLVSACGQQQVGYQITDRNHSISVTRAQQYPGSKWDTFLVVTRFPECQRRYPLTQTGDKFKLDLYRVEPGVFIVNQGKNWHVAETKECRQQKYDKAPPEPGELIGTFQTKEKELVYISKEAKAEGEESADTDKPAKSKAKKKPASDE